jgi:hypothetical protein
MRTHRAVAIAVATLGMMLAGPAAARAGKAMKGQTVVVPAGGYLYCVASADSRRPVNLTVSALDETGAPVADSPISSTTFRAGNGPYFVEQRVAFSGDPDNPVKASCQLVIEGHATDSGLQVCGCRFGEECPPCIP